MSASDLSKLGTPEHQRAMHTVDRNDVYPLQVGRFAGFGIAFFFMAMQLFAFFQQREMDSAVEANGRIWAVGGLMMGAVCGELIRLKRRIADLEKRLSQTTTGAN